MVHRCIYVFTAVISFQDALFEAAGLLDHILECRGFFGSLGPWYAVITIKEARGDVNPVPTVLATPMITSTFRSLTHSSCSLAFCLRHSAINENDFETPLAATVRNEPVKTIPLAFLPTQSRLASWSLRIVASTPILGLVLSICSRYLWYGSICKIG